MKKTLPILAMVLLLGVSLGVGVTSINSPVTATTSGETIDYEATVCYYVQRAGESEPKLHECSHNTLTTIGENTVKSMLGFGGTAVAVDYIALGNDTGPGASSVSLNMEQNTSGMTRAQGTYASAAGNGNWTISNTFTSTGEVYINTSALFNHTSETDGMFAGNNFTAVSLQNADQLTTIIYRFYK